MSANFDKYYDAFETPPDNEGDVNKQIVTSNDLQAMESRINKSLAESIERLESKLNVSCETQDNNETGASEDSDNAE